MKWSLFSDPVTYDDKYILKNTGYRHHKFNVHVFSHHSQDVCTLAPKQRNINSISGLCTLATATVGAKARNKLTMTATWVTDCLNQKIVTFSLKVY